MELEEIGQSTEALEAPSPEVEPTTPAEVTDEIFGEGTLVPTAGETGDEAQEKPKPTREELLAALKDSELTHDDLKEFDWYNRNLQRQQAALQKERESVQSDNRMRGLGQVFTDLAEKGVLAEALGDPPVYAREFYQQWGEYPSQAHARVLAWQRSKAVDQSRNDAAIAQSIYDGYRTALEDNGKFAPAVSDWDKITEEAAGDPVKFLVGLTERVLAPERAAMEKAIMTKAKAWLNGELAKRNLTMPDPARLPASGSGSNGFSVEHLLSLSGAEAEKYEAEHKDDLEAALRATLRRR